MSNRRDRISNAFKAIQDDICDNLERLDGAGEFKEDLWSRAGGGGGRTRIIEGTHIEKGGVNFSEVFGILDDKIATKINLPNAEFFATGVSIVLHPQNPWVPIIHMNIRYFESGEKWWFGGGIDLTPHYILKEDAKFFHSQMLAVCDSFQVNAYREFKDWADRYFYIPHRKESRGVGGIFFDQISEPRATFEDVFEFVQNVGKTFYPTYALIFQRNYEKPFSEKEKQWQFLRRGRYVEFNLVWDRGTKFGLETNGRTESILMSLPPMANWAYNKSIEKGTLEAETQSYLLKQSVNWLNIEE